MDDDEPITARLRGLRADRDRELAQRSPRVCRSTGGERYFIQDCPQCGENGYHHFEPAQDAPGTAVRLELAWCEDCGVMTHWRVLGLAVDGSERVLGPDFGADEPPSSPPGR